jgi:hypothetical protein
LGQPLITLLLILHDLGAVALLGVISGQALLMGDASGNARPSFLTRHRRVDVSGLAPLIAVLLVAVILLGATLYPSYRIVVRPFLETHNLTTANGAFEVKEHFAALALLMVPAYWALWRRPLDPARSGARRILTWLLTVLVWWNFLVGHVINYISGLFS